MGSAVSMQRARLAQEDGDGESALLSASLVYAEKASNNNVSVRGSLRWKTADSEESGSVVFPSSASMVFEGSGNMDAEPLVVEVIDVAGFSKPVTDVRLRLTLCRFSRSRNKYVVLSQIKTLKRSNSIRPAWHSYRRLFPQIVPKDMLLVELLQHRGKKLRTTFAANCAVQDLKAKEDCAVSIALRSISSFKNPSRLGSTANFRLVKEEEEEEEEEDDEQGGQVDGDSLFVNIRLVKPPEPGRRVRKRVYFIRHAESIWNQAKGNGNVLGMLSQRDHPLNRTGVQQAIEFNKRWTLVHEVCRKRQEDQEDPLNQTIRRPIFAEDETDYEDAFQGKNFEQTFFDCSDFLVSPLTRALQTALLLFQGHPGAKKHGLRLYSNVREVQNFMGYDSRGHVFGSQSVVRARELLDQELGQEETSRVMTNYAEIDPYDTASEWWSNGGRESKANVRDRIEELLTTIEYSPFRSVVVVGHSLFIRQFFQALQIEHLDMNEPKDLHTRNIVDQLRVYKIENCGCVGTELEFRASYPHMRHQQSLVDLLDSTSSDDSEDRACGTEEAKGGGSDGKEIKVQQEEFKQGEEEEDAESHLSSISNGSSAIIGNAFVRKASMMFGSTFSNSLDDSIRRFDSTT